MKNYLKNSQENAIFSLRKPYYQNFWQNFLANQPSTNAKSPGKMCYCNMSEKDNDLIGCDNKNCQIKWFHLKCLRIMKIPKERWFCPECRKAKKQKNNCSWIHVWFIIHWHFFHISKVFIANKYMFPFIICYNKTSIDDFKYIDR